MCTVTWHFTPGGYQLFFNRDELRTRATAQPPTLAASVPSGKFAAQIAEASALLARRDDEGLAGLVREGATPPGALRTGELGSEPAGRDTSGSVRYLAPTDTAAGGTWLAVNERGTAVGLLNSHPSEPGRAHGALSRGLLVRQLAGLSHAAELGQELAPVDLRRLEPFTLFALSPAAAPVILEWDGVRLSPPPPTDTAILSSSSVDPVDIAALRRQVLNDYVARAADPTRAHLEFHHSHRPERGARSPCMHRADAHTVSFTHVEVEESLVRLTYNAGPPCRGSGSLGTELQRVVEPAIDRRPALSGMPVE